MNGACDLDRRDCDRDAEHAVTIVDPDGTFEPLERVSCDRHVGWFRTTFEDRGYDVEIRDLAA